MRPDNTSPDRSTSCWFNVLEMTNISKKLTSLHICFGVSTKIPKISETLYLFCSNIEGSFLSKFHAKCTFFQMILQLQVWNHNKSSNKYAMEVRWKFKKYREVAKTTKTGATIFLRKFHYFLDDIIGSGNIFILEFS